MQKKHLAVRLRPDPMGELTAFPQTPELDLKGPTSKGGEEKGGEEDREGGKEDRRRKEREGGKGRRKGTEGERDLAPTPQKKILAPPLVWTLL